MRICLVHRHLHALARSGIGTLYAALAERLRVAGHTIAVLTQDCDQPLDLPGVRRFTLPHTEDLPTHRRAVAEVLRAWRPDVVDCCTWEAEILDYAVRPRHERAATVLRGTLSAQTMAADTLADSERDLVHAADLVCAVSDLAAADLAHVYQIPLPRAIAPGVDGTRFHPGAVVPPASGYRVRLNRGGQLSERAALSKLAADGALPAPWTLADGRSRVLWVGSNTPSTGWDRLERIATDLGYRVQLTILLGHSPATGFVGVAGLSEVTVLQDLDNTDLVSADRAVAWLLPTSRRGGTGLAIVEALACGTPVLPPADLAYAPEPLTDRAAHRYTTAVDLAELLHERSPHADRSAGLTWDDATAATLRLYYALAPRVAARS